MAENRERADDYSRSRRGRGHADSSPEFERSEGIAASHDPVPAAALSDSRLGGRGNSAVRAALVQRMQQTQGNRAANRIMRRTATGSLGSAIQRNTARSANSLYPLQRRYDVEPRSKEWGAPGKSNVGYNTHADMIMDDGKGNAGTWFNAATTDTFTVMPGQSGRIVIYTDVDWWYNDMDKLNLGGQITTKSDTSFKVTDEGKLLFTTAPAIQAAGGNSSFLSYKAEGSSLLADDKDGSITHKVAVDNVVSTQKTDGTSTTLSTGAEAGGETGGAVGLIAKGSAKVSAGASRTTSNSTAVTTTGNFRAEHPSTVKLHVPPDEVKHFDKDVYYAVNSDKMTDDVFGQVQSWYISLPPEAKEQLKTGKEKIKLTGHASTTGTFDYNTNLAGRRIAGIKKAISRFAPNMSDGNFDPENQGKAGAKVPGEDANERRVEIRFAPKIKPAPPTPAP